MIMNENQPSASVPSKSVIDMKKWTKPAIWVGFVFIIALLPTVISSPYTLHMLILTFIYIIASLSLRTILISGQFPLAHAAFMGIGAYAAGMASRWLGWSPWLTMPLGALTAMAIGVLIGYPFARLRALYYAMASLFLGAGLVYIIFAGGHYTGGYTGLAYIPSLFPTNTSKVVYYYFFLGLTLASAIALYRFEFSRIGVNLKAIAQSHLVASSVGINEAWYRIIALGVGCFFAGLAGAGYAHYNLVLSGSTFGFAATLWLFMYVLIGGEYSFVGPIIGTFVLYLVPEFFRDLQTYTPYISAGILLIVVYIFPEGLVGLPQLIKSLLTKRRKGERIPNVTGDS
jgi:branched-chain amino acid transport system permease protein